MFLDAFLDEDFADQIAEHTQRERLKKSRSSLDTAIAESNAANRRVADFSDPKKNPALRDAIDPPASKKRRLFAALASGATAFMADPRYQNPVALGGAVGNAIRFPAIERRRELVEQERAAVAADAAARAKEAEQARRAYESDISEYRADSADRFSKASQRRADAAMRNAEKRGRFVSVAGGGLYDSSTGQWIREPNEPNPQQGRFRSTVVGETKDGRQVLAVTDLTSGNVRYEETDYRKPRPARGDGSERQPRAKTAAEMEAEFNNRSASFLKQSGGSKAKALDLMLEADPALYAEATDRWAKDPTVAYYMAQKVRPLGEKKKSKTLLDSIRGRFFPGDDKQDSAPPASPQQTQQPTQTQPQQPQQPQQQRRVVNYHNLSPEAKKRVDEYADGLRASGMTPQQIKADLESRGLTFAKSN